MTEGTSSAVTLPVLPTDGPPGFHLLAKPSGSSCNIDCTYCFFLSKDARRITACDIGRRPGSLR